MASGLLIKQKQLLAGDGITIEHAQTSSTISLSNSTLNAAVRIYDATIASDTGVVTITDGTPVADLNIGDEIRTPDGVYQKVKNQIITTGEPNGTKLAITGAEEPAAINGTYTLENNELSGFNRVWKHDSENYYVKYYMGFWLISADKSNSFSAFFKSNSTGQTDPWNIEYSTGSPISSGAVNIENAGIETSVNNTIKLFEYASTSVASADIVQSVNGNKPDASGNVTINTSSGGLTSVSVGNGLTGDGTSSNPIKLYLNDVTVDYPITINLQSNNVSISNGHLIEVQAEDTIRLDVGSTSVQLYDNNGLSIEAGEISFNQNDQNTAGGFAIVGEDGKLPIDIIPDASVLLAFEPIEADGSYLSSDGKLTIQHNTNNKFVLALGFTETPKAIDYQMNTLILDYSDRDKSSFNTTVWFVGSKQTMLVAPATPSTINVSGAGSSEANGTYTTETPPASLDEISTASSGLWSNGNMKFMYTQTNYNEYKWTISWTSIGAYYSSVDVFNTANPTKWPWECTWEVAPSNYGTTPAPTVTI